MHDSTNVLLQHSIEDILEERGETHRLSEPGISEVIWSELQTNPRMHQRQQKVKSGRFGDTVARAIQMEQEWTLQKLRWLV